MVEDMPRRTGAGLSRERVLEAGLSLVDREGLDALTMRRLGRELGVEAMSLYSYVRSKQDLLDGVVERVYRELPPVVEVEAGRPWQDVLRDAAWTLRRVLLRHPNTVCLMAGLPTLSAGNLGVAEPVLARLRDLGLDLVRASQAVTVVVSFTVGHVASEAGDHGPAESQDEGDGAGAGAPPVAGPALAIDPARFPNVAERCKLGPLDRDASFALGLDFVVAGIDQLVGSDLAAR